MQQESKDENYGSGWTEVHHSLCGTFPLYVCLYTCASAFVSFLSRFFYAKNIKEQNISNVSVQNKGKKQLPLAWWITLVTLFLPKVLGVPQVPRPVAPGCLVGSLSAPAIATDPRVESTQSSQPSGLTSMENGNPSY